MKKLASLCVSAVICIILMGQGSSCFAQAPQGFNYQGVARDTSGNSLTIQNIGIKISILQDSATGTVVYSEEHNTTTDDFGVFDLQIGGGSIITGTFSTVSWGSTSHFAKIEMD